MSNIGEIKLPPTTQLRLTAWMEDGDGCTMIWIIPFPLGQIIITMTH